MTEKLKTLNDLREKNIWLSEETTKILKAEAIKWVKECKKARKEQKTYDGHKVDNFELNPCQEYNCDVVENFIMHFFNLTEEDINTTEKGGIK